MNIMKEQFSLVKLLQGDPDFSEALKKKTAEVKKDKQNLLHAATEFTEKYKDEIEAGTKQRLKMLSEGKSKGLTESEIFNGNTKFLPTIQTPILNFLHFMLRDTEQCKTKNIKEIIEELIKEYGYEKTEEISKYIDGILCDASIERKLDELGDSITFEDSISKDTTKSVDDIGEFIYGNLTMKEFSTVKKLKALSKSSNKDEAFNAYSKCLELCKRYNLEFDKVPCHINIT